MIDLVIDIYEKKDISIDQKKSKINELIIHSMDIYSFFYNLNNQNNELIDFCFKLFNDKLKKQFISVLAEEKNLNCIKYLNENNPDINTTIYKNALIISAEYNDIETLKYLLKYGDINTNSMALIKCCMFGNVEAFNLLLPIADPTFNQMICLNENLASNKKNKIEILKKLLPFCQENDIYNIVNYSIKNNDKKTFNLIYDKLNNQNLNNKNCFLSAMHDNIEIFELLIKISQPEVIKEKIQKLNNSKEYFSSKYIKIKTIDEKFLDIVENYILKNKLNYELNIENDFKQKIKRKI